MSADMHKRMARLAAPFTGRLLSAAFLGVATVACGVGLMSTSSYLLARAALHPSIADLQVAIVGVRAFGIARGLLRYLERLISHDATFRILAHLRSWFYRRLEPLAPARLLEHHTGDVLARIVRDIESLETLFLRGLAPAIVTLGTGAMVTALFGSLQLSLGSAFAALFFGAALLLPWLARRWEGPLARRLAQVRGELFATLLDGIQGNAELLSLGQETQHARTVERLSRTVGRIQRRQAWVEGTTEALANLSAQLSSMLLLAIAIPAVRAGGLDGVFLGLILAANLAAYEAIHSLPQAAQQIETGMAAAERVFELLDAEPAVHEPLAPSIPPSQGSLRIEGLTFRYTTAEPPALLDLWLELPPGGRCAIVGPSGAGKTTLLRLLLRFWDYEEGSIQLDGRELRSYRGQDLRAAFAMIPQDPYFFHATLRDNLHLAHPTADDATLVSALEAAQLGSWLRSLPQGLDTWLGEQGHKVSAGERQRIAIARAYLRPSCMLLLDEPIAHLDPLTAQQVILALEPLMAARTTLLVTHRLLGLEDFPEILVLSGGQILERGAHVELLAERGWYARMWRLQREVSLWDHGLDDLPPSGSQTPSGLGAA